MKSINIGNVFKKRKEKKKNNNNIAAIFICKIKNGILFNCFKLDI